MNCRYCETVMLEVRVGQFECLGCGATAEHHGQYIGWEWKRNENRAMKVHCRYCDTPAREIDHRSWWCRTCGSLGTKRANGSVEWTTPTAPAMEYDGVRLIAGTDRYRLVKET